MGRLLLQEGARVLFQGDSITDAGRSATRRRAGFRLPNAIAAWLSAQYPARRSASSTAASAATASSTWKSVDAGLRRPTARLGLHPHRHQRHLAPLRQRMPCLIPSSRRPTGASSTASRRDQRRVLILEPFVLLCRPTASPGARTRPRIAAVRACRRRLRACSCLSTASSPRRRQRGPAFWAGDGVHPSQAGHASSPRHGSRRHGVIRFPVRDERQHHVPPWLTR